MTIQSKSQQFANTVFPNVQEIAGTEWAAKYKTLSKKSGSLVRNSGLMQTLAFYQAKGQKTGEKHHLEYYNHLQEELLKLSILPPKQELFDYVRASSVPEYMYLTREILLLMNWHKRLADTLISKESEND